MSDKRVSVVWRNKTRLVPRFVKGFPAFCCFAAYMTASVWLGVSAGTAIVHHLSIEKASHIKWIFFVLLILSMPVLSLISLLLGNFFSLVSLARFYMTWELSQILLIFCMRIFFLVSALTPIEIYVSPSDFPLGVEFAIRGQVVIACISIVLASWRAAVVHSEGENDEDYKIYWGMSLFGMFSVLLF
jgi:hypothetical protein